MKTLHAQTLLVASLAAALFFLLTYIFAWDPKLSAVCIVLLVLAWNLCRHPRYYLPSFVLALGFAVFITTAHHYEYDTPNMYLAHMNVFPLVMWTAGLMLTREVYLRLPKKHALLTAIVLYWIILFVLEYIGYYWVGIRLNEGLPSFLGTGVLHGTPTMHIFYPAAGPVFILFTDFLYRQMPWLHEKIKLQ